MRKNQVTTIVIEIAIGLLLLLGLLFGILRYNTEQNRFKFYSSYGWRKIREQIRERDNNECQDCKKKGKVTIDQLEVHHIKE